MSGLAAIRPDEWNLPLFLHVLGALAVIGTLALAVVLLLAAWRSGSVASLSTALRTIALGVFPSWIVLRFSAEWIADKEGYSDMDSPPAWIDIGYIGGDAGLLLIIVASVLGYLGLRRARREGAEAPQRGAGTVRAAAVVLAILLVVDLVALWAMTTKPV
jgi:hypothetical protein